MIKTEPLAWFLNKYGFNADLITEIINGEKYTAVMLKNGSIGVCATIERQLDVGIEEILAYDLQKLSHRIVINAYLNAFLNYQNEYQVEKDIFDQIDFSIYKNIVMIGYFESLYQKFMKKGLNASIFDLYKENEKIIVMEKQLGFIKNADAIVLSATSIYNDTFLHVTESSPVKCDVFLLGPSSILSYEMLGYKNLRYVFGSVFNKNDHVLLDMIRNGAGTKDFMIRMKKVFIKP